jgi:DNA polymerase
MSEHSTYVGGFGPLQAKLAVIGIAPGSDEVLAGRPFVGPSGRILRQDLREGGINPDEVYMSNIFKYKLPNNEFKRYQEMGLSLKDALVDLQEEINAIKPNCILGLGDPVLASLMGRSGANNGINVWRGSILNYNGTKAVFTWHPAAELHGQGEGQWKSWQRYVRKFDVRRAVKESDYPDFRLPQRLLHVARSSTDVYRFIERYRQEEFCAVDIEAIENIPVCIGLSFRHYEGFCIPLWNNLHIQSQNEPHPKKSYSYNLKVSTIPSTDLAFIWQQLAELFLNSKIKFIGQNFKYDEDKINRLGFYINLYWDIMIGSHCRSSEMPKGLAFNTSIDTEEPYYKYEGRNFIPGKDNIEDLFVYNCKDSCVTREIFEVQYRDLQEIPFGIDHALWRMGLHKPYLDMDNTGFKIDENERKVLIHKYVDWLVRLEVEFQEILKEFKITERINLGSPVRIAKLFYEELRFPKRDGTGEQVLTALIGNVLKNAKHIKLCEIVLEWRRVDKSLQYLAARPDYDGRMKTTWLISGTENFRTSTNKLEEPIRPEKIGWALQTVSKHGDIGNDLRSILIADPNYVIVNIDQSQAEARVCSLLADDEETLSDYDRRDKHAYTASKFFGGTEQNYSKKVLGYECPERFVGKTLRHAYHLGIGKHEAMINVNTDARKYKIPIRISEWRAGECLKILAQDTPKIQTVFHVTIQELLRRNRRIVGTFGASRYFFDEMDTRDLWKGAYSFIPQQTVSDKTKQVLLKVRKNLWHIKVACEAHDALTFLIPDRSSLNDDVLEIQSYFAEPIAFDTCSIPRRNLVIPTDVEIGIDYCNLKKYKKREKVA